MNIVSVVLIAIGLSMDAFAVALTYGMVTKQLKVKSILKVAVFFGVLQTVSPLIGWAAGIKLKDYLSELNQWAAIALLSIIGIRMIIEAIKDKNKKENFAVLNLKTIPLITFAVSFDELAAGLSFAFLKVSILQTVVIIGITTFIMSLVGILIGKKFGAILKDKAEFIGGLIFILIGLKRLVG